MKSGIAVGVDGVPVEIFKVGGAELTRHFNQLVLKIWHKEEISVDLRDAAIVTVFKKGDKVDHGNYRVIPLQSIVGKTIAWTISTGRKTRRKLTLASLAELHFVDDISTLLEENLQASLNAFPGAYGRIDLSVNLKKTQILSQSIPGHVLVYCSIKNNGKSSQ
eukprot:g25323.t1